MSMSPKKLRGIVNGCLPERFRVLSAKAIVLANRRAGSYCACLPGPERRDLFGHIERAHVQAEIRRAAKATTGMRYKVCQNSAGTSSFTVVRAGRVVLTASAVQSPGQMPREAEFRTNLALSPQITLSELLEPEPVRSDELTPIYGLITHARGAEQKVSDVRIVIPDETARVALCTLSLKTELEEAMGSDMGDVAEEEYIEEAEVGLLDESSGWHEGSG